MRTLNRITPPTVEPIGLDALQEWLPQAQGVDEGKILATITASRCELENYLQRSFLQQTWEFVLDEIDIADCIELPRPPLVSVTSVKAYDIADVETTVSSAYYTVEAGEGSRLWLRNGQTWNTYPRTRKALVIRYVSGYGTLPTDVPDEIRTAVKELTTLDYWHPMRGRVNPDGASPVDLQLSRQEVLDKVKHLQTAWAAL